MNLNTIHRKVKNLVSDLESLQSGEWEPDEDSVQASLDAAEEVEAAFPLILDMSDMLSDIKEWLETGKVDGVGMDADMILAGLNELNGRFPE